MSPFALYKRRNAKFWYRLEFQVGLWLGDISKKLTEYLDTFPRSLKLQRNAIRTTESCGKNSSQIAILRSRIFQAFNLGPIGRKS